MKREEIEKKNEAAIRLVKQKKRVELDRVEENNRKRFGDATLHEFELLDAACKCSHCEITASARRLMRSYKFVKDWINTSLALGFINEKTTKPEVTTEPPQNPGHNNGQKVEDQKTEISKHSIQNNIRLNIF